MYGRRLLAAELTGVDTKGSRGYLVWRGLLLAYDNATANIKDWIEKGVKRVLSVVGDTMCVLQTCGSCLGPLRAKYKPQSAANARVCAYVRARYRNENHVAFYESAYVISRFVYNRPPSHQMNCLPHTLHTNYYLRP